MKRTTRQDMKVERREITVEQGSVVHVNDAVNDAHDVNDAMNGGMKSQLFVVKGVFMMPVAFEAKVLARDPKEACLLAFQDVARKRATEKPMRAHRSPALVSSCTMNDGVNDAMNDVPHNMKVPT